MRKILMVGFVVLLIMSLLISSCQQEVTPPDENTVSEQSDQEILSQHPDDLDGALPDLELVEES